MAQSMGAACSGVDAQTLVFYPIAPGGDFTTISSVLASADQSAQFGITWRFQAVRDCRQCQALVSRRK